MRVCVDDGSRQSSLLGADSKMNGNSALAASSFLTNDRDDFHTIPLSDWCNRLVSSRLDSLTLSPYHGKFSVSVASWSGAFVSAWDSELRLAQVLFAREAGAGRERITVLELDNADCHTEPNLVVPDGIRLAYLPRNSPELKPAEPLWPVLDEPLANRYFATVADERVVAKRYRLLNRDQLKPSTNFRGWPKPISRRPYDLPVMGVRLGQCMILSAGWYKPSRAPVVLYTLSHDLTFGLGPVSP